MPLGSGGRIGAYEIGARIGAGGMGEVYRGTDINLKRAVALKVLPEAVANDAERLARFQREAELLAALNHPNIAQIHGLERDGGVSALVMEMVDGPTLADRIADAAIPLDEALAIAKQIAAALEAAHEQGIVHRDLKPANVKVRADGTVKVLDFGLAKAMERPGVASPSTTQSPTITTPAQMTAVGVLLGTAAYMSPEQAKGRAADKRSDIWAFGAVLFEMLARRRPFPGDDLAETLAAVIKSEPDWAALPIDTPPAIHRLLRRCLEKDPKRRLPDIGVARLEIDDALAPTPDRESAPEVGTSSRGSWQRSALWVAVVALAAATASLLTWFALRSAPRPPLSQTRFGINLPPPISLAISLNDRDLALSPDGRLLAFTAGDERRLMLRALDNLDPVPLNGIENARAPFFSPDGRWIAFFDRLDEGLTTGSLRPGYLRKVAVAGGTPIVICQVSGGSRGASWASNDTIVFATNDTKTGLLRVPAGGGEPTVLTAAADGRERDHQYPSVLPDDRGVLFTVLGSDRPQDAQVAVLDFKSGQRKIVVRRGSHAEYLETGHIVYVLDGTLWAARFDLAKLEVVGDATPIVERAMVQTGANFALSHSGTLAYVPASGASTRSLVWVDRAGNEQPINSPIRDYGTARLSPDDGRVAFAARTSGTSSIWTWDLGRATLTRVEFGSSSTNPVWAPDGRSIFFSTGPVEVRTLARHSADAAGATEELLTAPGTHRFTSISPDGGTLLYEDYARDTAYDLLLLPLSGKRVPKPLLTTKFDERNGTISPDGRWIGYESNESGRDEVYVRPFPNVDDGKYQISTAGGRDPVWARNGGELFFANGATLLSARVESTPSFRVAAVAKLFDGPQFLFDTRFAGGSTVRSYDVSRDGRRFLMIKRVDDPDSQRSEPSSIIVVQNWTEELMRRVAAR